MDELKKGQAIRNAILTALQHGEKLGYQNYDKVIAILVELDKSGFNIIKKRAVKP